MRLLITIALILAWGSAQAKDYNVGIQRIATEVAGAEVAIGVFYPTQEEAVETSFGPWTILAARNHDPQTQRALSCN